MRQDVSPAQARKHLEPAWGWVVEMRHDWKPGLPLGMAGSGCRHRVASLLELEGTEGSQTRRWREADSNPRSHRPR